jgi:DNA-binding IclR family transcriptional regulator
LELVCASGACGDESDCVQLTERESAVCRAICESPAPVSFGELKERADLHQEVLSRVIRRLTVHGLVEKTGGRYSCKRSQ